ncbi:hypothetical protein BCD49_12180 [Pseudofrankia sp. EUN1h]|nr:hypothetical protein BCD49_12180 [Pseudofrankia sp. EUN1h]
MIGNGDLSEDPPPADTTPMAHQAVEPGGDTPRAGAATVYGQRRARRPTHATRVKMSEPTM